MQYVPFKVSERVLVYWDPELSEKNLQFLKGIDASYYEYMAKTHAEGLDGESKVQAGTALRIAYFQGLETLLALLCALTQASTCMVGWMQSYKTAELLTVVKAISSGSPVVALPRFRPATWDHLAVTVHGRADCDDARKEAFAKGFGRLWSRFAADFLNERTRQEYNALKHGLRPKMGGHSISVGPPLAPGAPVVPENMQSLGGSAYGSTFFVPECLHGKLHWRPTRVSVNWTPQNLIDGLAAIAMSVRNVVTFARHINGDKDASLRLAVPGDTAEFDLPWAKLPGVLSSSLDTRFGVESIDPWNKQELEEMFGGTEETSS